jgi:hypothetical protein
LLHVVVSILSLGHGVNMREHIRFGETKLNAPGVVSVSYINITRSQRINYKHIRLRLGVT